MKKILLLSLSLLLLLGASSWADPRITDIHEHIESLEKAKELLLAMKAKGIKRTVLLASPVETITSNAHKSFTGHQENMKELFKIAEKYPDAFIPFCTLSPLDPDPLELFKGCLNNGGKGLKLYNGHSYYYDIFGVPLDSPRMMPIYAYAERNHIPIVYHVNITKYKDELETILKAYPDLRINVPHFMVSSQNLEPVADLMSRYPNLYTEISFGSEAFLAAGFRRISRNAEAFRDFIIRFQDRVLFGADMVLTEIERKDLGYMRRTLDCYRDLLETEHFKCKPVSDYYQQQRMSHAKAYERCEPKAGDFCDQKKKESEKSERWYLKTRRLKGLHLSQEILDQIYEKNAERFLGNL